MKHLWVVYLTIFVVGTSANLRSSLLPSTPVSSQCPLTEPLLSIHAQRFSGCLLINLWDGQPHLCQPKTSTTTYGSQVTLIPCLTQDQRECHSIDSVQNMQIKSCFYYILWGSSTWASKVLQTGFDHQIFQPTQFFIIVNHIAENSQMQHYETIFANAINSFLFDVNINTKKFRPYTFNLNNQPLLLSSPLSPGDIDYKVFQGKFNDFGGRTLRAALQILAPFAFPLKNGPILESEMTHLPNDEWDGIDVRVVKLMGEYLNFNVFLYMPPDLAWGVFVNGSWNGMVGDVYRKQSDLGLSMISISKLREDYIDFAYPLYTDPMSFVAPMPPLTAQWMNLVIPFTFNVWLLTFLSVFVTAFVLTCVARVSLKVNYIPNVFVKMPTSAMLTLRAICIENNPYLPKDNATRLIVAVWFIFTFIITSAYGGILVSFLTTPLTEKPIRTFSDLLARQDVDHSQFYLVGIYEELYMKSGKDYLVQIWQTMNHEPTVSSCFEKVFTGRTICIDQLSVLNRYELVNGYTKVPQVLYAKEKFFLQFFSFPMQPMSPIKQIFDHWILTFQANGIMQKWNAEFLGGSRSASVDASLSADRQMVLQLLHFEGAFYLVAAGYILGIITIGCEILLKRFYP